MKCCRMSALQRAPLLAGTALLAYFIISCTSLVNAEEITIKETGSTLMLPLLQHWSQDYAKVAPDVRVPTAGTGSGAGISAAIDGTAQLVASDAYMSDVEVMRHPGVLNIPLAISAQTVNYNLPDLTAPLRLSGPVLAGIYAGSIRPWNDAQIAALNPGVTLPDHPIVPIRRSDASGDTFIFTQFLTFSTPGWEDGPGFGTAVKWPDVPGMVAAEGNAGVLQKLTDTPYGVAYIGASFVDAANNAKLGTAMLKNDAGQFVLPTAEAVSAAAAALTPNTPPDERLTLAFAPGEQAYPLINYEYAIVRSQQPNAEQAAALRNFLLWAITPNQGTDATYLAAVHFIPLPTAIRALSEIQIDKIR